MKRDDLFSVEPVGHEPTGQIEPQDWMTAQETQAIFDVLESGGAEARFIGGCVRDALAKRPIKDVDIATTAKPDEVVALLTKVGIKVIPTGIKHGTVTAVLNKKPFEITTLRVDAETDGRHAKVEFTDNWFADASRRDFTFNALSATRDGAVYDPFSGISDLAHGNVKFIGRPADRIAEDHLRILRYFRFLTTHGRPPASPEALQACRSTATHLEKLSGERVRHELMIILNSEIACDTLLVMRGETILEQVLPEAGDLGHLRSLIWLTTRALNMDGVSMDQIRNLAVTISPQHGVDGARSVAERWRLSNADADRLVALMEPLDVTPESAKDSINERLYRWGSALFSDRVLIAWSREVALEAHLPNERTKGWMALLERAIEWRQPDFPIKGEDVIALGVESGPQVGQFLRSVESWWISEHFIPDRAACLQRLKEAYNGKA